MFSRWYLLVLILTCLCSSAFTRDTEGNVTLSKVEVLNTSDTSLAVGLNTTVSLWIQFKLNTDLCNSPLVQWCGVAVQKCGTGELSNITDVYISNLTITTAPKDYGEYRVLVCGKKLDQTFAIDYSGPVCRNNGTLPDANYITPPLAVYGVGRNVTLVCVFHGDIQEEDFHVCWNNSDTCLQPGARYHIDHSTALNCTSTGEIVIMNVTFNDSATYTCYAESRSIHYPHGGYQSTNLSILGVPEFIKNPSYTKGTTGNSVEFAWIVQSNENYIAPFVLVNGTTNLSNITSDYEIDYHKLIYPPTKGLVDVTLVLNPVSTSTDLKPGTHEIQLCVPFTADVVGASDYNQNPKCSDKIKFTLTTADGHQLVIIIFTCVIVIFLIVGSFAIAVCVFVVIRHHRQNSTERENLLEEDSSESVVRYDATKLGTAKVVNPNSSSIYIPVSSVDGPKQVFILNDSSTDARTQDLNDILNQFSTNSDGTPVYKCQCIPHHNEIIDDWTNWVVLQITQSHHVLLVCSIDMKCCLEQSDSINISTTHGELSSISILNAIRVKTGKFSLVFLDQPTDNSDLIPMALKSNKRYSINTEEVKGLQKHSMTKEDLADAVQRYIKTSKGKDLKDLFQMLR